MKRMQRHRMLCIRAVLSSAAALFALVLAEVLPQDAKTAHLSLGPHSIFIDPQALRATERGEVGSVMRGDRAGQAVGWLHLGCEVEEAMG